MSAAPKTLLFCELEANAQIGSWPSYQQWLSQAPHHGLRVEQARFQPDLSVQLERADALFICSPDALCPELGQQIRQGKKTFASFCHGTSGFGVREFWSDLGLEITHRGIFPLDPPAGFDHPQALYLKTEHQGNSMALALLDGTHEHEFSAADRIDCTEDWSPAFVLPRANYCDYVRGEDRFDFFPEIGDPYFAASRCFEGDEPTLFFSSNAFMAGGLTTIGGYPTSGYREHRNLSNQVLKWLAGDLSVGETRTERIRSLWFRFETTLHRRVCRVMTEAFGDQWAPEHLPESLKTKVAALREHHGAASPADSHFYFVDYATIIRHHWDLFGSQWPWLAEVSKARLKEDFGSLNKHVRTPAAHPARLGDAQVSEESEQLLRRYFTRLK
jgi:hypothetical protein